MDSSNREHSKTGAKRDTHEGKGASALDQGQRSKAPQASGKDASDTGQRTSDGPGGKPADQRDDGRGRDAGRNGSDSGSGKD